MDSFLIQGSLPLSGTVSINGSKNASLPIIFAALLGDSPSEIRNVPNLSDTCTATQLLREMGASCECAEGTYRINPSSLASQKASYDLVRTMRASILALGPVLAKTGKASIYMPGGCAIGARPIDMHIAGLEAMGAHIRVVEGYIEAQAARLRGCDFTFHKTTVTGTANLLMAACLAEGTTLLRNAAIEPEIADLCGFLASMGADISWQGERTLVINGVKTLKGSRYRVSPDRIEAGTFMAAAIATRGNIRLEEVPISSCTSIIRVLREAGADIEFDDSRDVGTLTVQIAGKPKALSVTTEPYPGFPTDMQAQLMAIACLAEGKSSIHETVFESRFMHALELQRMGADIRLDRNVAEVNGRERLTGAHVMATDLRASACLVIAGLGAQGTTHIDRVYHLDRGYEALERRFQALGADISRISG